MEKPKIICIRYTIYDSLMLSITSYTKVSIRIASFCSIILMFIGLLVEYILYINTCLLNGLLVIEGKRINF